MGFKWEYLSEKRMSRMQVDDVDDAEDSALTCCVIVFETNTYFLWDSVEGGKGAEWLTQKRRTGGFGEGGRMVWVLVPFLASFLSLFAVVQACTGRLCPRAMW